MSLDVATRHELRGELFCQSAVHVGGWDPSVDADLTVARDGLDRPLIPGTSLAGALRAWLGGAGFSQDDIEGLFGHVVPGTQDGSSARIRVDDAQVIGAVRPVVRDGVGIDRNTGSAAAGFLYEREVLPAGTRFAFRLVADEPGPVEDGAGSTRRQPTKSPSPRLVAAAFETLAAGLTAGQVPIGAGRTRGLGRVVLQDVRTRSVDLSTRAGMIQWLSGQATWQKRPSGHPAPVQARHLDIEISWHPLTPVLVKDSIEGVVVDTLPLTETDAGGLIRLLLPGSSVKGVLRAHAERIVRTLTGKPAKHSLREELDQGRLQGVAGLFGYSPEQRRGRTGPRKPQARGWRGALEVADCRSLASVPSEAWQQVLTAHAPDQSQEQQRQALRDKLDAIGDELPLRIGDHVAIDRWTGGAAEALLFSVLEPGAVSWEPIRLRLDVTRAGGLRVNRDSDRRQAQVAMALLLLLLRDLADGWLGLGFGSTRGHGQIQVDEVRFSGGGLPEPWSALVSTTLAEILEKPPAPVSEAMKTWAAAIRPDGGIPDNESEASR